MASSQQQPSLVVDVHVQKTLSDLHKSLRQLGAAISDRFDELLDASFSKLQDCYDDLHTMSYLQFLELILRPKGFALLQESASFLELILRFSFLCVSTKKPVRHQIEMLARNEVFIEYCEDHIPNVTRWFRATLRSYLRSASWLENCRVSFYKSPAIIGRNPAEAARLHKAEEAKGYWRYPPAEGKVRIHFFKDHRNTKHLPQGKGHPRPDVRIDLDFDPRSGVDLRAARKTLGAESLAIITDVSPFRRVFDPVSQDRLSPVAAYDLSKHFAEPIRVYELNVSLLTRAKRGLQEPIYLTLYFVFILIKSMLGFPLADTAYTSVTYGKAFASRCTRMSKMLRPLNQWASEGVWLLAQLIGCLVLLPFALLYHSAKGIKFAGAFIATNGVSLLANVSVFAIQSTTQTTTAIVRRLSACVVSLSGRGWLAVLALSWFMIAELKASIF